MENKFKVGDIVRIVRDSVGYSENFMGQECEVTTMIDNRYWVLVTYKNNYCGMHNLMFYGDDLEIVRVGDDNVDMHQTVNEATTKITSTGGSSDYYKLNINGSHVETEDVIYAMVGGDFALGNALKALRRMYLDSEGGGKEGVDMSYDANKVKYFVDSFVKRFGEINDD